ncbi:MAG: hypothetical protein NTW82_10620 [Bacteroidia bacterium]|nr:hypothetical protein [Bacteroidia bacterium]
MKYSNKFIAYCLFTLLCVISACEKKEVPTLVTTEVTEITANSAKSGGSITSDGGAKIISSGVCWSTESEPTITNDKTTDIAVDYSFTSNITDLEGGTTYYVKAYATNREGIGYGSELSFTTLGAKPTASSQAATNITKTTATLYGTVNPNWLSTTVTFEYGTTTSYGSSITVVQSPISGDTTMVVSANISGLTTGETYHFRVVATNSLGTTNGDDMQFIANYIIGGNSAGGIIFYLDNTGQHGLACASKDQGSYLWGCEGTRIGGTSNAFGTGAENTALIVAKCSDLCAARVCNDLVLNGYNDWYLPSLEELIMIYNNLYLNSIGGLLATFYWSSSEYGVAINTTHANGYSFNPYQDNSWKSYELRVRAIRTF